MRAAKTRAGWWHWVAPDRMGTLCGRSLLALNVASELDLDHVPIDGRICVPCEAARLGAPAYDSRHVVLPHSYGTLRKTGPLIHGTHSFGLRDRHGQHLPRHEGG